MKEDVVHHTTDNAHCYLPSASPTKTFLLELNTISEYNPALSVPCWQLLDGSSVSILVRSPNSGDKDALFGLVPLWPHEKLCHNYQKNYVGRTG